MTENSQIPIEIQQIIAPEDAYSYRVVPYAINNQKYLCYTDAEDLEKLQNELQVILNLSIELTTEKSELVDTLLSKNYRISSIQEAEAISYTQDFLEKILMTAKSIGSSDVHFEPFEEKCRVRYRLDGKLKEQFYIPIDEYPIIINKIKNRASLDISQNRLPQDGRISMQIGTNEFDIRVSTLRTLHGESIVLRILSKDTSTINLADLGFTEEELKTYREAIKNPNGIVLISGPTGSGKTTTLYATLKLLNEASTKILTIEDPIEYTLEGVNQVQLREDIGLDFPSAMRTFLRQDPDVIMVGEIRDVKTANMAIRAALTGHLVLSTIHTNSAWATVSRLIDMGVPPFLIASTLNISVAQRLVRKLCTICKKETSINVEEFPKSYKIPDDLKTHYIAEGCQACHHTGYSGRMALYEIIPITKELQTAIKAEHLEIDNYLSHNNIPQLKDHATRLIKEGITSLDEVFSLLVH
ncbi:type IV pilus assembly protein PilB [Leeuwenhoekiella aestuarii]|uniref:GspE/PulE family protein n=1 Tax=Leeuwenhoekiella aestuarii TaxID=2249426 RepID=UPI000FFE9C09|nr:GspE/PulE family protein [Leeuwenhoekiella aestuarii]RXG11481.1 type IV pilus assembly protein PilB [Leeuwenhoekiella aestuarii]